jgi:hypothetical protein
MLINPALHAVLEVRKVDDSAYGIHLLAGHKNISHVVVTVEMFALAAVLVQAMTCTKLDAAHYR